MDSRRWRAGGLANREPDLDLDKILDELLAASGAEAAELFLAEPNGGRLWLAGHRGVAARAFRQRLSFDLGEGFPGLAAATRRPVQSDDLAHDDRFLRDRVKGGGFRHCLSVPVLLGGRAIGSLELASRREPETVGGWRLLAASIAGHVGDTLELAQLRAKARVSEVAGDPAMDLKRNLERKLGGALEVLLDVTGAEGGIVLLSDPASGSLHPWVWRGSYERACSSLARAGGELSVCTAATRQECLVLSREEAGLKKPCSVAPADLSTIICVPLARGEKRLGALSLGFHARKALPGRHMIELGGMVEEVSAMVADGQAAIATEQRALEDQQRRLLGEVDLVVERSLRPVMMRVERAERLRAKGPEKLAAEMATIQHLLNESSQQIAAGLRKKGAAPVASDRARAASDLAPAGFLDVRCLGQLAIFRDGQPILPEHFTRRRAFTLLKVLLTNYGRPVHREVLIELLWPEASQRQAASQLKVVAHYLRRGLRNGSDKGESPEYVLWTGEGYEFDVNSPHRVDTQDFLSMVHWGNRLEERDDGAEALAAYRAAAALYCGDFLEDERYSDWCAQERAYLRDTYLSTLRRSTALMLDVNDVEGATDCRQRALRMDPAEEKQPLYRRIAAHEARQSPT